MSTRIRKAGIHLISDQPISDTRPSQVMPILATSVFCDDVRLEATGKVTLVGCYPGNVVVSEAAHPVDRLWVFTKLTWGNDFDPAGLRMRADFPAQETGLMNVQPNPVERDGMAGNAICVWQLRFYPLRPGDVLRVAVERGGSVLPCGEILAIPAAQVTRH